MTRNSLLLGSLFLSAAALAAPAAHAGKKDIIDTAIGAGSFKTLAAALTEAELVDVLRGPGPFTVFAPTDDAFARLPKGTVASLLEPANRKQLQTILTYHVVSGDIAASAAIGAGKAATLQKEKVAFSIQDGRLRVNNAGVIQNDIRCSNGIIHVIDTVLLPEAFTKNQGRKVIGVNVEHVSRALSSQLKVNRSESLLVTKVLNKSNAQKAGLAKYDVVTSINGHPATSKNLDLAKNEAGVGGELVLDLIRGGKSMRLNVTVGSATN